MKSKDFDEVLRQAIECLDRLVILFTSGLGWDKSSKVSIFHLLKFFMKSLGYFANQQEMTDQRIMVTRNVPEGPADASIGVLSS